MTITTNHEALELRDRKQVTEFIHDQIAKARDHVDAADLPEHVIDQMWNLIHIEDRTATVCALVAAWVADILQSEA